MISEHPTEFPVKVASGKTAFLHGEKGISGLFHIMISNYLSPFWCIITVVIFIHLLAESVARKSGAWSGIAVLTFFVIAIRLTTYFFFLPY